MCDTLTSSSSLRCSASYSKQVAEGVIRDLHERNSDASLASRDLEQVPLPHVDEDFVATTWLKPKSERTNGQSEKRPWDGIQIGVHDHSVWHTFLDAALHPRTVTDEGEITEYLHRHRHDLPPAVLD